MREAAMSGPGPRLALAQPVQPPDHLQVLLAGQVLVDRGVLTGEPDGRADLAGLADHVQADDLGPPRVRRQQRAEDAHDRRLAGAVGPEQAQHGALGDGEVDPVERGLCAEPLDETLDDDGIGHAAHARTPHRRS
jgi:hypothetical protein